MFSDEELLEIEKHLEELKSIEDISISVLGYAIVRCERSIKDLEYCAKKDLKIYKLCSLKYQIYSLFYGSYNDEVMNDLNKFIYEAKCQRDYLKVMKKILNSIINNVSCEKITDFYETLYNIILLQKNRYDYFEYISILDDMKYKNIYYIPGKEVSDNNKELIKKISNSLDFMTNNI